MTNSLDDLASFDSASLPKVHTSGRRELRAANLQRGFVIHARPKTAADKQRALTTGAMIGTLPIRRLVPKLTKAERRAARQQAKASMKSALFAQESKS
jgi:hypothetical protein